MEITRTSKSAAASRFFWIVILLGAIVLFSTLFAGVMTYRYGSSTRDYGWKYEFKDGNWRITEVSGKAVDKLAVGDQILAIDGDERVSKPLTGSLSFLERFEPIQLKLKQLPLQGTYQIRIARNGTAQEFQLQTKLIRDRRNYLSIAIVLFSSIFVAAMGLFIGIMKPQQRVAQLICIALVTLSLNQCVDGLRPINSLFNYQELLIYYLIFSIYPFNIALIYHFFYRFPDGIAVSRGWSRVRDLCYFGAVVIFLGRKWIQWAVLQGETAIDRICAHTTALSLFSYLITGFELLVFGAMIAVMINNYRHAVAADQRRRIRWIIYGALVAALPWGVGRAITIISGAISHNSESLEVGFDLVRNISIITVPLTIAYSVVKHRVFDVTVVIRRSLQYMLAKNFLKVIVWLPVVTIVFKVLRNPNQTIAQIVIGSPLSFTLFGAAIIGLKFQAPLRNWIDRQFFREAYNQEQLLLGLIEKIKDLDSLGEIARVVSCQLDSALHPKSIYVFYRKERQHELTLGYSTKELTEHQLTLSRESSIFQMLAQADLARLVSVEEQKWGEPDREWLEMLGINLIVPMPGSAREVVGLLLLGERRSEEPYSHEDRKLLQGIAAQMALAYEMTKLREHIDQEQKIKHEVLSRLEAQQINIVKECPQCQHCFDSTATHCPTDNRELSLSLPVERTIKEKYRLERLLGKGGMGAVYEATDLMLKRRVAIKILIGNLFGNQAAIRRFEREARTSAMLNHANIISVYDYGRLDREGAYLVMELVSGETMGSALRRLKRLEGEQAARWFADIFAGLTAAHQAGIVHRDLKPENIFIARDEPGKETLKLLDFGISKVKYPDAATLNTITNPGTIMGTLGYMSPEQLTGDDVDGRSDIFSLGVIIFEALTGERPFKGRTLPELLMSMMRGSAQLPGETITAMQLNEIIQRCLARRVEDRLASVTELRELILPLLRSYHAPVAPAAHTALSEEATKIVETKESVTTRIINRSTKDD